VQGSSCFEKTHILDW